MEIKDIPIHLQEAALKSKIPECDLFLDKNYLRARGQLKPSPRSCWYSYEIKYRFRDNIKILILNPKIKMEVNGKKAEHLYKDGSLCLFFPKAKEFNSKKLIVDYIIPWVSLWLFFYEIWLVTGEWKGGGIHPQ
ncbi:hypothetical protein N7E81_07205 [Reichenbachiella carrageenanivorans]|uniref:Type II CBASS E2 protein domain-containing protein n=1 Tax=Reichenbachiella carrageenanivorans TaxID=2979869 RepID=A0ABY6D412_9BACT|nr:hypothetical protein [Reichenbachiella carrageenanivorans]UXX80886.1 hypothetical protein N7E81_07205 [Reichenbachiella carrageenanivorans]